MSPPNDIKEESFKRRLGHLLEVAPASAGFIAFIIANPNDRASPLKQAEYGFLFMAFCCFAMITWQVFIRLTNIDMQGEGRGLRFTNSATFEEWRDSQNKLRWLVDFVFNDNDAFEAAMQAMMMIGATSFYVGMVCGLWDYAAFPVFAKVILLILTAPYVVYSILSQLDILYQLKYMPFPLSIFRWFWVGKIEEGGKKGFNEEEE